MMSLNGKSSDQAIFELSSRMLNPSKVYPTLQSSITLTSSATGWTLGAFAEVVPVNTILAPFALIGACISAASDSSNTYEIVFYAGDSGSEVEIGRTRLLKGATNVPQYQLQSGVIPANTRISAKCANGGGSSATIAVALMYVEVV